MLAGQCERYPTIGLDVWRGGVDPELALTFAAESLALFERAKQGRAKAGILAPDDEIYSIGRLAPQFCEDDETAIAKILGSLGTTTADYGVNLLWYPPGAVGCFHPDEGSPIKAVKGGDGVMDISPRGGSVREAEQDSISVEFSAGDVLVHTAPYKLHRIRNPGSEPHVSAAIRRLPPMERRFDVPHMLRVA